MQQVNHSVDTNLQLTKIPTDIDYAEMRTFICGIIMEAYQYCGQQMKGQTEQERVSELNYQTDHLLEDLQDVKLKRITLNEIKNAFRNGLKGEYGVYMGLNNKTYAFFLKSFVERKIVHYTPPKQIEAKLTPEQIDKINEEALKVCFDIYKRKGEIIDRGSATFKYLWRIGKIRFDKEQGDKYLLKADQMELARLNAELANAKLRFDKTSVIAANTGLDRLMSTDPTEMVKAVARKLALLDYFKTIDNETALPGVPQKPLL